MVLGNNWARVLYVPRDVHCDVAANQVTWTRVNKHWCGEEIDMIEEPWIVYAREVLDATMIDGLPSIFRPPPVIIEPGRSKDMLEQDRIERESDWLDGVETSTGYFRERYRIACEKAKIKEELRLIMLK